MGPWVSRSRPGLQLTIAVVSVVVGLLLMIGMRGFPTGGENVLAGFALGVLLLVVGIAAAVASGPQTVTVDPHARRIEVADSYFFGARRHSIPFSDVREVGIGYLGQASNTLRPTTSFSIWPTGGTTRCSPRGASLRGLPTGPSWRAGASGCRTASAPVTCMADERIRLVNRRHPAVDATRFSTQART